MDATFDQALTELDKGALMRFFEPVGRGIAVFGGSVWITQEDDTRDFFVHSGESFTFDRPGLAIVQAMQRSRLLVFERSPAWTSAGGPADGAQA